MTARMKRLSRCLAIACSVATAGCGGSSSASSALLAASPQNATVAGSTFSIAAHLGVTGTISFPVVPGAGGTGTLLYSTTTIAGLPELSGPPLAPELVEYLCVSFSTHQVPVSAPALTLNIAPADGAASGVGLAYFQVPSNSWNQTFGVSAFATSVTLVARDAVFYRPDRTCFALYLTAVTPLP
jgi:hypothetical protein